jgi:hypothetical protein
MRSRILRLGLIAAAVAASASCGNVVRQGRSPVYLTIDSLQAAQGNHPSNFSGSLFSDVLTIVTSGGVCTTTNPCPTVFNDVGQVVLRAPLKDIGSTANPNAPTTNNEVTINRFHVEYVRADGRNTPGIDVPYPWDGGATGTVSAGGTLTLSFELVRHTAKEESPLVQLVSGASIISTIAKVTFYGTDAVGNAVSVTGNITIDFGNFGDIQ